MLTVRTIVGAGFVAGIVDCWFARIAGITSIAANPATKRSHAATMLATAGTAWHGYEGSVRAVLSRKRPPSGKRTRTKDVNGGAFIASRIATMKIHWPKNKSGMRFGRLVIESTQSGKAVVLCDCAPLRLGLLVLRGRER